MSGSIRFIAIAVFCTLTFAGFAAAAADAPQSPLKPTAQATSYPKIVLYSTSWCPHCKQAKEYFTKNNIPFINRDVELDDAAMEDLTKKYRSQGVPVLVIGNDEKILKGFNQGTFEKAVKEVQQKK
ncbi:glutaredoxin domain-containing protein [Geomobilimonas luticola]|uniref:Glutaredoxin family protein n=1 Tax=Geomobilimonas luticola TaxID=1114878 RepID=A0ABS5SFZ3_9BACT|nr:glutaredoxin domain-containing protein [Geomobilimonas luticola]MBT0654277.1 glutaredoxin family protein [Geomobilimonas luticola]